MKTFAMLMLFTAAPAVAATGIDLRYIGEQRLPGGLTFDGTVVGGLSGIDYDAATGGFKVIADDRSALSPARVYDFTLSFDAAGFTAATPVASTVLLQPNGTPYPLNQIDPEAIRFTPTGTLVYSSEGEATATSQQTPFIREMTADGRYVADYQLSTRYSPSLSGATGIRNNLAFESLTVSPDGTRLFTATENALAQDGPAATLTTGSPSRIIAFDTATRSPVAEFVYLNDPVAAAPNPAGQFTTNGLVELLALSSTEFIALERSFSVGAGYSVQLFHIDISNATNVIGIDSLSGANFTAATKTLLFDLDTLGITLDNLEGVSFGPTLANGNRSLVLVSDNNFTPGLFTQFLAFEVSAAAVPEPASWAMMIAGFGIVGGALRRRKPLVLA